MLHEFDYSEHAPEIFAIEKVLFPAGIYAESADVYGKYLGWVLIIDGKVIGFCLYDPSEPIWMLATIGVTPEYQGRKLARMMLDACVRHADACGVTMQLRAWQGQCHLVRLYQQHGFVLWHGTENAYGSPMMVRLGSRLV